MRYLILIVKISFCCESRTLASMRPERFDEIMKISPRRFHISASPPYGVGIVFCNHINNNEESEFQLTSQRGGIRKCKPGIWRSVAKEFGHDGQAPHDGPFMECYVHWVADGTIDMTQAVKEWEKYDVENREKDAAIDIDKILPDGVEWVKAGSYYDDGGVCSILSTEYLTMDAAKKVMFAGDEDKEVKYGYYLETITLNHCDGLPENSNFTLGGMNCTYLLRTPFPFLEHL